MACFSSAGLAHSREKRSTSVGQTILSKPERQGSETCIGETDDAPSRGPALARPFAKNRRDGARQISIAVVISAIGLLGIHHPMGVLVVVVASAVAIYWGLCYRTLDE